MVLDPSKLFKITIYSHFFKVTGYQARMTPILNKFYDKYAQMGFAKDDRGRNVYRPLRHFGIVNHIKREYRYHIGQLSDFMKLLEFHYIAPELYEVETIPLYESQKYKLERTEGWQLRDYQQQAHDFIVDHSDDDLHTRLIAIYTGGGKTKVGLASIATLGDRFLIVVLPKYTIKWTQDIQENIKLDSKDIAVINGSGKLGGLIDLAKSGQLKAKAIVISLVTMRNYFKDYEKNPEEVVDTTYGCAPEDLCKLLKVGTLLVDEAHEHIHAVYQLLTHTHVNKAIMLTATMRSNELFITEMHKLMFPKEIRFDSVKMEQYIAVYPVAYQFKDFNNARIRTQAWGSNMYSHIVFEQSIMRNKPLLESFLAMVLYYVKEAYTEKHIKGDKLAVYAASIEMCDNILAYLKRHLKGYDIRRYAEQDPYENVIDSDIRVTTVLSAGTAVDIPNLRAVVMTNSILAPVSNLQVLGRLRKLKDRDVKFYYLYCTQVPKQVECHNIRKELFKDRVSSIKVLLHYKPLEPIYSQYGKRIK